MRRSNTHRMRRATSSCNCARMTVRGWRRQPKRKGATNQTTSKAGLSLSPDATRSLFALSLLERDQQSVGRRRSSVAVELLFCC